MFPKCGTEIVSFREYCPFLDVEAICEGIKVQQATHKFKVGVGKTFCRVVISDELRCDVVGPFVPPNHQACGPVANAWWQEWAWEPNTTCTGAQCVVMALHDQQ